MAHCRLFSKIFTLVISTFCSFNASAAEPPPDFDLSVMSWNIWHGGKEDGEVDGPRRVAETIKRSGADIVAMQETYGSGEAIAKTLDYKFLGRGTNVSILSKYEIIEDISVFEEFKCVGALIQLPGGDAIPRPSDRLVAIYSIWLPFDGEIWKPGTRDITNPKAMRDVCQPSACDIRKILTAIKERLADSKYNDIPVIIAGDFNSMSHLDYVDVAVDQYDVVIEWETSRAMIEAGYRDTYRECNPSIDRQADRTWTPRFPEQEEDRIDFVYYRGNNLDLSASKVIDEHTEKFPSDHAAVVTQLKIPVTGKGSESFGSTMTYNIHHGAGMDGKVDLERIAKVLGDQRDFIGLQEVDDRTKRTGGVNQAAELGKLLRMHAAFGSFMDFQGGRYGVAILSKHQIIRTHSLRLPNGNEPRVALVAEVLLPDGISLLLVNVHFDWVDDDKFRFAQAQVVANYLKEQTLPFILLGDFNDQPGSRTLKLFTEIAKEAAKPKDDHFTFSSTKPEIEIDFIFAGPPERWRVNKTSVLEEKVASDHRPFAAELMILKK